MLSVLGATGLGSFGRVGVMVIVSLHSVWSLPEMHFLLSPSQSHTAVSGQYWNLQLLAELCKWLLVLLSQEPVLLQARTCQLYTQNKTEVDSKLLLIQSLHLVFTVSFCLIWKGRKAVMHFQPVSKCVNKQDIILILQSGTINSGIPVK